MLILSGSLNTQNALKIYDGNNITLDISKYQKINLNSNSANITLPIINENDTQVLEILLFITTTEIITLTWNDTIKWQNNTATTELEANKSYEFVFTSISGTWYGGVVVYE